MKPMISVIIPLYKGKKYIPQILNMMAKNSRRLKSASMEVVFINDYPEEKIELDTCNCTYSVKIFVNDRNMGIHKSRIKGIELCSGDYILMLDQDDVIADNYLENQYSKMGSSDWIVSSGIYRYEDGSEEDIFMSKKHQLACLDKWCYYMYSNPIASPGQVLLRKKCIPDLWKNTYLRINGSDDYFLWILLVENKARGVINPEKLYVHISTGENTSLNEVSMKRSDYEVTELLSEKINWWKIHRIRRKAEYFTTECKTWGVKLKYMDVGIFRKVYQICRL